MNKQIIINVVKYDVRDKLESDNIRFGCHIMAIVYSANIYFFIYTTFNSTLLTNIYYAIMGSV